MRVCDCYKLAGHLLCSRRMQAASQSSFQPAAAGALLATGTAVGIGAGALVGWAAGSVGLGILGGALVGVPVGVFAVYRRYRGFFA
jgi:F0F1-type ATP synthase assembly protein I